ncbi:MAG: hypothetical protein WCG16_08350 [Methylococcales bacterium]
MSIKKNGAIVLSEVADLQEIKVMFGDRLELLADRVFDAKQPFDLSDFLAQT